MSNPFDFSDDPPPRPARQPARQPSRPAPPPAPRKGPPPLPPQAARSRRAAPPENDLDFDDDDRTTSRSRRQRHSGPPARFSIGGWIMLGACGAMLLSLILPWEVSRGGILDGMMGYSDGFRDNGPVYNILFASLVAGFFLRIKPPLRPTFLSLPLSIAGLVVAFFTGLYVFVYGVGCFLFDIHPQVQLNPSVGIYLTILAGIVYVGGAVTRFVERIYWGAVVTAKKDR